jgi:uncharacterized OB-fold protein
MAQTIQLPAKPVPIPDELSRPFFDAARRGELVLQRCRACGQYVALGSRVCTECLGEELDWTAVSGRGTLFTFGIMHQLYHPAFEAELPYNLAVVELDEGPRLNSNVVGVANNDLRIGMRLEATFTQQGGDVWLPRFKPLA